MARRLLSGTPLEGGPRRLAIGLEAFVALGAVYGGVRLLVDAEGFGIEASWLDGSPFSSYLVPGLVLLLVLGGGMGAAAILALRRSRAARGAALLAGLALLAFLLVETVTIGFQGTAQLVLVVAVGVPALILCALGRPRPSRPG